MKRVELLSAGKPTLLPPSLPAISSHVAYGGLKLSMQQDRDFELLIL